MNKPTLPTHSMKTERERERSMYLGSIILVNGESSNALYNRNKKGWFQNQWIEFKISHLS